MILGAQKSTPIAAMEVILNLRPIELDAQTAALLAAGRLRRFEDWRLEENSSLPTTAHYLENKITKDFPNLNLPTTNGKKTICFTYFNHRIDPEMRNLQIEVTPSDIDFVHVFTDGSKNESEQVGYGYTIKSKIKALRHEAHYNLGTTPSVFQAEIMAIKTAADRLYDNNITGKTIEFYIDNQAAIYALKKVTLTDNLVLETKRSLNQLTNNNQVRLNWIPGHSGFLGNEVADRKAKLGTLTNTALCEPAVPVMDSTFRTETDRVSKGMHDTIWKATAPLYKQSRLFFHELRPRESKWLLRQSRDKVHDIIGLITGHDLLGLHQYRIGNVFSPLCRICGLENETSVHLITECEGILGFVQRELGFCPIKKRELKYIELSVLYKVWEFAMTRLEHCV